MMSKLPLLFAVLAAAVLAGCVVHDRRGFGGVYTDRNIQLTAAQAIGGDRELAAGGNVKVIVYNGVVLLAGQAPSEAAKARAGQLVGGYQGVLRVVNALEVGPPESFWERRRDNALTARVKTGLLDLTSLPGFSPGRINVTTAGRVVYLMGIVSHAEADAVTDIARHTDGVGKVVTIFDYND